MAGWQAVGSHPEALDTPRMRGRGRRWSGATGTYTPFSLPGSPWPPPAAAPHKNPRLIGIRLRPGDGLLGWC